MAVAAVTPRVRTIVICDDVSASPTENGVFDLTGVRQHIFAESFPCRVALSLFMLLSSARKGDYTGRVVIVNERNERMIRYVKFAADFDRDNQLSPFYLEIDNCVFPEAGAYDFEVYFSARDGEALKGEHPFAVLSHEE